MNIYWFGIRCVAIRTIPRFYGLFLPNSGFDRAPKAINQAAMPKG